MAMKPKTKMTMPMFQTNAGSGSCRTIMNPIQMSISPRLTSIMRQQMPLVFGQKGLGADMVSTTTPALVVEELGLTRLDAPDLFVLFVRVVATLCTLRAPVPTRSGRTAKPLAATFRLVNERDLVILETVVDCGLSETAWLLAPPSSDLEAPDTLRRSCADLGLASGGGPASRSPLKSVPPVLTTEAEAYGPSRVSWLLMVYFATLSAVHIIVKSNCHHKSYICSCGPSLTCQVSFTQ